MKGPMQYVNDAAGNVRAVLIRVEDWNKLVEKMRHYEQMFKMRSALTDALREVELMRNGKLKKQPLSDFLREL